MRFPDFGLLHYFEEHHGAKNSISFSDMQPFHLKGFERDLGDLDLSTSTVIGLQELRKHIGRIHGVGPERVLVTCGASEANFLVAAALLDRGDAVLAESPTYPPMRNIAAGFVADVQDVARDPEGWALDPATVRALVTEHTRLLAMTNLNNPTSAGADAAALRELAALAEEDDFHIHIDETFRELAFDNAPPSAATISERFVVTSTLTKVYGVGGLRIGWAVAAPDVLRRLKNVKDYVTVTPPWPSEVIALWTLERRAFFLERARRILAENRRIVREWLDRNPKVHWDLQDQGNLAFPRVEADMDALAARMLKEHETVLAPGRLFGYPDRFRLGYGRDARKLQQGLEAFDKVLRSL
ncbi:MAG TPA: pyridoxal phosphate-dependent aminotransferase [Thermoplasmata archaeon]|nr:pyridoxal phosphate-dependent aminotransferase [Thermoplasmata archaeon]